MKPPRSIGAVIGTGRQLRPTPATGVGVAVGFGVAVEEMVGCGVAVGVAAGVLAHASNSRARARNVRAIVSLRMIQADQHRAHGTPDQSFLGWRR
jgi:hypothetical protein